MSEETLWHEPFKSLNGVKLTIGQAMTLRVALEAMAMTLAAEGLGDDEAGKGLTQGYLRQIESLREIGRKP